MLRRIFGAKRNTVTASGNTYTARGETSGSISGRCGACCLAGRNVAYLLFYREEGGGEFVWNGGTSLPVYYPKT
jgi:hypothetical protein